MTGDQTGEQPPYPVPLSLFQTGESAVGVPVTGYRHRSVLMASHRTARTQVNDVLKRADALLTRIAAQQARRRGRTGGHSTMTEPSSRGRRPDYTLTEYPRRAARPPPARRIISRAGRSRAHVYQK